VEVSDLLYSSTLEKEEDDDLLNNIQYSL